MKTAVFVMLALLAASLAQAQDVADVTIVRDEDIQLEPVQEQELSTWIDGVREYRKWYESRRNRVAWNAFGAIAARKELPPVVEWLPAKCDVLAVFAPRPRGVLADACDWLSYYRSNFTIDPTTQQALQTQIKGEEGPHRAFLKHIHLDAGWTAMDYRAHAYGLVGVHVTLPELAKRIQIFIPPGFLLVSLPDGHGGRRFEPAMTIGVSIKMFQFEFPQNTPGTAYFNLAKAYVISRATPIAQDHIDLVGMSFSWGR